MNLYKVIFTHYAPLGNEEGIKEYVLCEDDNKMYDYVDSKFNYDGWKEKESDLYSDEYSEYYKEDAENPRGVLIKKSPFRVSIINNKGQVDHDDNEYLDLFYGLTHYGWELVKENVDNFDFLKLKQLGVIVESKIINNL
jgi:hypothetical protein